MSETNIDNAKIKFIKAIELLRQDLITIRTGRASPSLIEHLEIIAYGTKMKLIELATIHAPEPHMLVVTPFDVGNAETISKAIASANLGLNPVVDNNVIRISVPLLTEERRKELIKLMHQKLEAGRVMLRQIRHEVIEEIKKTSENEDEQKRLEKELQTLHDEMIGEIDLLGDAKEKELMII